MRCQLVEVTRTRRGQPMRNERIVEAPELTIGRGPNCSIRLPDAGVQLLQATVSTHADGRLYVAGNSVQLRVNGVLVDSGSLRPNARMEIGPYLLIVERPGPTDDFDFGLSFERIVVPGEAARLRVAKRAATSLAAAGLTKRTPALLLFLLIALTFLIFPVLQSTRPDFAALTQSMPIHFDETWNPGPLARAHRVIATECKNCHQQPFIKVMDSACLECHRDVGPHIRSAALQATSFEEVRCADCHREHRGVRGMDIVDGPPCASCHANLNASAAHTPLRDASDFATRHPDFALTIQVAKAGGGVGSMRVLQTDGAALGAVPINAGLKFPHDVHLVKAGVVNPDAPAGAAKRIVLTCANCHQPDGTGTGFRPISMESDCVQCHRLAFEPADSARQVPHGSVLTVMTTLREFYARAALDQTPVDVVTVNGGLQRPGVVRSDVQRKQALAWAEQQTRRAATDLFEVRSCNTCHTVTRTESTATPYAIAPVVLSSTFLPKAKFEHAKHATDACSDCHAAQQSRVASDALMPSIGKCRECHTGLAPERNKLSSDCVMCHDFHSTVAMHRARIAVPVTDSTPESSPSFVPSAAAAKGQPPSLSKVIFKELSP